jgi:hypothetical protein
MTTKKVRIYKAPDGKGQYINKTSKFLNKAQFGGQDTPQQDIYSKLTEATYIAIKKGQTPKSVYDALIAQKIDATAASEIVKNVIQFMISRGELESDDLIQNQEQELEMQKQMQKEKEQQERITAEQASDTANEEAMDSYNKQSMDIANDMSQYNTEEEENQNTEDVLGFRRGGAYYKEDGGTMSTEDFLKNMQAEKEDVNFQDLESLIKSTPGAQSVSFPGIEEYYMPYVRLYNDTDEIPVYDPTSENVDYKFGGKTKRKFTDSVLKLLKKEEGGEDQTSNNLMAKPTDNLTNDVQNKKSSFVNAISDEAKKVKIGEYYEQMQKSNNQPYAFGGPVSYDPLAETLSKYIYGGDDQFAEESKNINDPYFSDLTSYPQMQDGGDASEYTHYTHGQNDIFHDNMNMITQAKDGLETGNDEYALDYIRQLADQMKGINRQTRRLGRQYNRFTGNTLRDYLLPFNRGVQQTGFNIKQKGDPFMYGTNEVYEGDIDPSRFIARDTYKTGFFGPKKFIDYYSVGNEGLNVPDDLSQIQPYRQQKQKQNVSNEEEDEDISFRQARRNDGVSNIRGAFARMLPEETRENREKSFPMLRANDSEKVEDRRMFPKMRAQKKQEGGEAAPEFNYYDDLISKLNLSNEMYNYQNELEYKRGGRVLRMASFGLNTTPIGYGDNSVMGNTPDPMEQMTAFQAPNLSDSDFETPSDLPGPTPAPAYVEAPENDWSGPQMSNPEIDYPEGPQKLQNKIVGVKRKAKNMYNVDGEAAVNMFNTGAKGVLGGIDRMRNRKQEANMYAKNFDPTQIYGKKERIDKGDYDVNTGLYRVNQMGADRLGRSKKYGGYMQPGGFVESDMPMVPFIPQDNMIYPPGDSQYPMVPLNRDIMDMLYNRYYSNPDFNPNQEDIDIEEGPMEMEKRMVKEGGETYMSDEQINAFLAEGGEIEYL